MASEKNLNAKKEVVNEILDKLNNSNTFLLLENQGLSVADFTKLRDDLKANGSNIKVYKNTLMDLALKEKNIELNDFMTGPNVYVFSKDIIEPIKAVSEFAKENDNLKIKAGYIDGNVVGMDVIKEYASIPSYEGLLTMFAGGLIEHVKNLSIALNLYAEKLEGGEK